MALIEADVSGMGGFQVAGQLRRACPLAARPEQLGTQPMALKIGMHAQGEQMPVRLRIDERAGVKPVNGVQKLEDPPRCRPAQDRRRFQCASEEQIQDAAGRPFWRHPNGYGRTVFGGVNESAFRCVAELCAKDPPEPLVPPGVFAKEERPHRIGHESQGERLFGLLQFGKFGRGLGSLRRGLHPVSAPSPARVVCWAEEGRRRNENGYLATSLNLDPTSAGAERVYGPAPFAAAGLIHEFGEPQLGLVLAEQHEGACSTGIIAVSGQLDAIGGSALNGPQRGGRHGFSGLA